MCAASGTTSAMPIRCTSGIVSIAAIEIATPPMNRTRDARRIRPARARRAGSGTGCPRGRARRTSSRATAMARARTRPRAAATATATIARRRRGRHQQGMQHGDDDQIAVHRHQRLIHPGRRRTVDEPVRAEQTERGQLAVSIGAHRAGDELRLVVDEWHVAWPDQRQQAAAPRPAVPGMACQGAKPIPSVEPHQLSPRCPRHGVATVTPLPLRRVGRGFCRAIGPVTRLRSGARHAATIT